MTKLNNINSLPLSRKKKEPGEGNCLPLFLFSSTPPPTIANFTVPLPQSIEQLLAVIHIHSTIQKDVERIVAPDPTGFSIFPGQHSLWHYLNGGAGLTPDRLLPFGDYALTFFASPPPVGKALVPLKDVTNHLPMKIGDYTDFYAGLNHAFNVGVLFRGPDNALQPNYKHLPVGYHGRASSVIVSGQPVRRPNGQILANPAATPKVPIFSPCKKLDIELELAVFVGKGNKLGEPIPIDQAEDHLFGVVLMNDWSARDIQAWEYVPLGPFNAKNFATSITPWVVLMDALEPFRSTGLAAEEGLENLLPYLREKRAENVYDMQLQFDLKPANSSSTSTVAKTNAKNLLYSFAQMLTHHSVTGCNMNTGDLLGSGTISGKETGTLGSLLENTQGGKQPMKLSDGSERVFLEDGDEVTLKGMCGEEGSYVGFGDCTATILPAHVIN
ncbi:fumarylacetoacetase [Trichophyton equinum CBS 127.97]|uniref:Fumarylacetoacetase n=1 Tax=Trichophyton equinum (strain ATCC MYA-4606 / CBS 127.97) TaxID=559882 RepID=F2Q0Y4_TRIEC|nr:fumarylacetoacetase [Trichophyton equinum CBS 127.97]